MKPMEIMFFGAILLGTTVTASATPYTGTASPCTSTTPSNQVCSVDMLDFMKSKYAYNGHLSNSDNMYDTTSNSLLNNANNRAYDLTTKTWTTYNGDLKAGFMKHPTVSNSLMFSPNASPSAGYFLWDGGMDNSIYVVAEPTSTVGLLFKSFSTTNIAAAKSNWQNRGYYWSDKKMDMTPVGGGKWTYPDRITPVSSHYDFNTSNVQNGVRLDGYDPSTYAAAVTSVTYYSNMSDPNIPNGGSELPSTMEIVELKYSVKDASGQVRFSESYYYGRQNLNAFGLIRWRHSTYNPTVCSNGLPTGAYPNVICDTSFPSSALYIDAEGPYAKFVTVNLATWWGTTMATKWKNDVKFTRRGTADAYGNVAETGARPRNRGGILPQGAGNDSTLAAFTSADWIYMESSGVDEDWYLYPSGMDPIYPTAPSNYCRDGYEFVGAIVTTRSYNLLNWGGGTEGDWAVNPATGSVGTVYPAAGPSPHWVAMCGTKNTSGPTAYINASDAGEDSCAAGYAPRFWFNSNHTGVTACPAGQSCFNGAAKNYINFCVKASECVGACAQSTSP
ncbi:hypothetical protein [Duganella levis]|uniref:Uncharacterized protein n=1 Tax=Duganella levis TaxID=2692169 RepID=A0ABW9VTK1_9BURK|nr:hypothetical protein [Duganella levis]MYN24951.1 hypothetical protein [Duganella levis]